jgi:hypothetical protein
MEKTAINQAGQMAENLMALTLLQHLIEVIEELPEQDVKEAFKQLSTLVTVGEA